MDTDDDVRTLERHGAAVVKNASQLRHRGEIEWRKDGVTSSLTSSFVCPVSTSPSPSFSLSVASSSRPKLSFGISEILGGGVVARDTTLSPPPPPPPPPSFLLVSSIHLESDPEEDGDDPGDPDRRRIRRIAGSSPDGNPPLNFAPSSLRHPLFLSHPHAPHHHHHSRTPGPLSATFLPSGLVDEGFAPPLPPPPPPPHHRFIYRSMHGVIGEVIGEGHPGGPIERLHIQSPEQMTAAAAAAMFPWMFERKDRVTVSRRIGHPYQNRSPPKRKKPRTSFTRLQILELEKRFHRQKYLASAERSSLSRSLSMSDTQIKTWFQNRRTKWRRQTAEEREAERQAANRFLFSLHPESRPRAIYNSPDPLCMNNASLQALHNLQPWAEDYSSSQSTPPTATGGAGSSPSPPQRHRRTLSGSGPAAYLHRVS